MGGLRANAVYSPYVQELLVGVGVALALGVIGWFARPLLNRIEFHRMKVTSDHRIRMLVYASPEEMDALGPDDLAGLEPLWLTDYGYYFASGLPDEDPPQSNREWSQWAERNGGEGASFRHVLIRLQATQDRTVLLLPPKVHVERTELLSGVVCSPEGTGGDGLMARQFFIDLDASQPSVKYFGNQEAGETPQFVMRKGDSEVFVIIARAVKGRYEWYLDVMLIVDGVEVRLPAMDGSRPFVTFGYEGIEKRWWAFDERRWLDPPW